MVYLPIGHHVQSDFKRQRRVFWSIHAQNNVRVVVCQEKANRRGSFNNIFISGGRPANVVKLCPHFNNRVNSRGENDLFPKINELLDTNFDHLNSPKPKKPKSNLTKNKK